MAYQVAIGHDQAGALADISVQPKTRGLLPGRRQQAGNRAIYEDGYKSTYLEYSVLTATEFSTLLTEFGVASAASAEVTIRLKNDARSFANYNATIVKPELTKEGFFEWESYENVKFSVIGLEAL